VNYLYLSPDVSRTRSGKLGTRRADRRWIVKSSDEELHFFTLAGIVEYRTMVKVKLSQCLPN
jgi:hypothetical protein